MPPRSPRARQALAEMQRLEKIAGKSDGQQAEFERAFFNISQAYLVDRVPKLAEYEVAFQMLDRDADGEKAVGIHVIKLGADKKAQVIYCPHFFHKGDLKGDELGYMENQDAFFPLIQPYVDHLMRKRGGIDEGLLVSRQPSNAGVRSPDLSQMVRSPLRKWASSGAGFDVDNWLDGRLPGGRRVLPEVYPGVAALAGALKGLGDPFAPAKSAAEGPRPGSPIDLVDVVERGGPRMLRGLVKLCELVPAAADRLREYYGDRFASLQWRHKRAESAFDLADAIPELRPAKRASAPAPAYKVAFHVHEPGAPLPFGLSPAQQMRLRAEGALIEDERPDGAVSSIRKLANSRVVAENPGRTGIWDIMTKPGTFERCLVVEHALGPCGASRFATVVFLDREGKPWLNIHTSRLWGKQRMHEEFLEFLDGLPSSDAIDSGREDTQLEENEYPTAADPRERPTYLLLHPEGKCGTVPLRTTGRFLGDGPKIFVDAEFHCEPVGRNFDTHLRTDRLDRTYPDIEMDVERPGIHRYGNCGPRDVDPQVIELNAGNGTLLRAEKGRIRVGSGIKSLRVMAGFCGSSRDGHEVMSGQQLDYLAMLMPDEESRIVVIGDKGHTLLDGVPMSTKRALDKLVHEDGLRFRDAWSMLTGGPRGEEVAYALKRGERIEPRVESAPAMPTEPYESTMSINGRPYDVQSPRSYVVREDNPGPRGEETYDPDFPQIDRVEVQRVQEAADSGVREVFEASVLKALLNANRMDLMVNRFVPDMFLGNDRIGRVLFCLYWHTDDFTNRFGRDGVVSLEDGLRSAFQSNGEILLNLKQKGMESDPELARRNVDPSRATA